MLGDEHRLPLLVCFDMIVAYLREAHLFFQRAMEEAGLLGGMIAFIIQLYRTATLHLSQEGGVVLFSRITAGVVQRSP